MAVADFGFAEADVTLTGPTGSPAMQAGVHPFALSTTLRFNTVKQSGFETPDEDLGELWIEYPAGLVVAPTTVPACSITDFEEIDGGANDCSDSSAIGIAEVTASSTGPIPTGTEDFLERAPVYRLPADRGVARVGLIAAGQPIVAELGLTEAEPYRGYLWASEIPESLLLYSARVTIWGTPADPSHDADRGACALSVGSCPVNIPAVPFLTTPRSCNGPLETIFEARSRQELSQWISETVASHDNSDPPQPRGLAGCGILGFSPWFSVQPTTDLAETPSGLEVTFAVFDEGLTKPSGIADAEPRDVALALPEGLIVDPAASESGGCTPAQYLTEDIDPEPGEGCPSAAEIGTVEVETSLLDDAVIEGKVFMAEPDDPTTADPGAENPFDSALALYVVLRHSGFGVLVKQAGEVEVDPLTEQLTISFDQLPQIPISRFGLSLDRSEGGLLLTPPKCGEFTTTAAFTPWSSASDAWLVTTSFEIVGGPDDGPCPSGEDPPDEPEEEAGEDPGSDDPGAQVSPGSGAALAPPPPGALIRPGTKPRSCPKGKRWAKGKGRCVRKRCSRAAQASSVRRRCPRRLHSRAPR